MTDSPTIVKGTNDKPVASESLARFFESADGVDGQLFIGYPIIGGIEGKHPIDAVYVSPTQGVVVFDLVEGLDVSGYQDRQDDAATRLKSRLLGYKELVRRRDLAVAIHTVTYAPAANLRQQDDSDYLVANTETLASALSELAWQPASVEVYERTLSAIQNISTIRRARSARKIENEGSRGAKLQRLEAAIATLDNLQGKAVIETVEGVQRIRGLAGSGKTIVLALKAAYLHAQHPSWRIAVTFNTRSLKGHLIRLINLFTIEATGEEPDWANLRVVNAWGARGGATREGIYYDFCVENGTEYFDYISAKSAFGRVNAFKGACRTALETVPEPKQTYDAILVDEAQDLPPEFLRLCRLILREPRRLVYAYDELQNLSNSSLPSATEIFGITAAGEPEVSFKETPYDLGARRDIILSKCYRNSRPVLVTAHALGFGIYRTPTRQNEKTGLVQMFDEADLWEEIGYHVKDGALEDGRAVTLERTAETSPAFLETHSPIEDIVQFHVFGSAREQAEWVASQIQVNLTSDELRPDDLVVVNPDPLTTNKAGVGMIRKLLFDRGIASHIAGVDTAADVFFRPELEKSVTFSGIHRAKGNEAAMVYVVNAHESYDAPRSLATIRNRLFTAITRSKAWVRVVGVGEDMERLKTEFEATRDANFELRFRYPTEGERNRLQVVHRDVSPEQAKVVQKHEKELSSLVRDLRDRRFLAGDLDDTVLAELRALLEQEDE
ncbi:DEAD/DEAH box helicase [Micromonospora sp. CNB394]|uniref:DEAD/DEAH box helicase n=1 Tax=Micromonospora sp. CNB394 TaxID=1169151 RepID=UPI00039AEA59|nr:ATP-binding domain-containing protein [Micromonospora sp. CNB394]